MYLPYGQCVANYLEVIPMLSEKHLKVQSMESPILIVDEVMVNCLVMRP